MSAEVYPVIESQVPTSDAPDISLTTPVKDAINITHDGLTVVIDISYAVTVEDVKHTLMTAFHLRHSARIIVKRASDGAIVVPGPRLPPGDYILEEVDGTMKKIYKKIVNKHLPEVHQNIKEKHLPVLVETSRVGAERIKDAAAIAHLKTGQGLVIAGAQLNAAREHATRGLTFAQDHATRGLTVAKDHATRGLTVAKEHLNVGLAVASDHAGKAVEVAGTTIKTQVARATTAANTHAIENPTSWTAKLWVALVSCAGGPISWASGIHVDELIRARGDTAEAIEYAEDAAAPVSSAITAATSIDSDSAISSIIAQVPLSKAAGGFL